MSLTASVGQGISISGREAGERAASEALLKLSGDQIRFALIFASRTFNIEEVVRGIRNRIDEVPCWGISTSAELSSRGEQQKSVVVGLIAGRKVNPYGNWWTDFERNSQSIAQLIQSTFELSNRKSGLFLIAADGVTGDVEGFLENLFLGKVNQMAGCLAGGDIRNPSTHQIGGRFSGAGGLSAAIFDQSMKTGIGTAHGWKPTGQRYKITQSEGVWIQSIDHRKPSEVYADLFGKEPEEWTLPPLNQLARLYPLEIELFSGDHQINRVIRSPLWMASDGSIRMSAHIPEQTPVYFMVGSVHSSLEAVKRASLIARDALGGCKPALAIVLADKAYQMLFEGFSDKLTTTILDVLGPKIPILGGYTNGQLIKDAQSKRAAFLNQHIQIIVFGNS